MYNIDIINFTYNEPSIYSEYIYDVSKIAKKENIKIILISNGYLTDEAIDFMSKYVDAVTIDIKGNGNEEFARKYISIISYEPVFNTIEELYKKNIHLEITDLVIPEIGDNLEDAKKLAKILYDIMGENSNIHFLRFFPEYKLDYLYPTPIETLHKHVEIAKKEGIRYVYIGNLPGNEYENTYCPNCRKPLIKRYQFTVYETNLNKDRCIFCGYKIYLSGEPKISEISYPLYVKINKKFIERKIKDGEVIEKEITIDSLF